MKSLAALLGALTSPLRRWNVRVVVWMLVGLLAMVAVYSAVFHQIMAAEGRAFSWPTSVYWTLTTMSTLGFGDITFESDLGRLFSVAVLTTGALYILVLMPFAFIQFIFVPWMDQRETARAPRRVPDDLRGHIVVTRLDSVTQALIARAKRSQVPHVVVVADPKTAMALHDEGYRTMVGPLDGPGTYRAAGVDRAALVATTQADTTNTNIAFTVREINRGIPIVATANSAASVDVLELAGCDRVIELADIVGTAMARRVLGTAGRAHVVGGFGAILIAEAGIAGTRLIGESLGALDVERQCGLTVLGVGEGESLRPPDSNARLSEHSLLVLAGSEEALAAYDRSFCAGAREERPVIILGGGRVGRAAARVFDQDQVPYTIVERTAGRAANAARVVHGDAAELEVLREAGLDEAAAILVTTHEDDVNVYLTLYGRRLRPDVQIIARAIHERNVATLHRAGADSVLSYAVLGATSIWNVLGLGHRVALAEGIELFTVPIPRQLVGRRLHDPDVLQDVGCHIAAVVDLDETTLIPTATIPSAAEARLLVMGDRHSERRFRERFHTPNLTSPRGSRAWAPLGRNRSPVERRPERRTPRPDSPA